MCVSAHEYVLKRIEEICKCEKWPIHSNYRHIGAQTKLVLISSVSCQAKALLLIRNNRSPVLFRRHLVFRTQHNWTCSRHSDEVCCALNVFRNRNRSLSKA